MQKLLLSLIVYCFHAENFILGCFTFILCKSYYLIFLSLFSINNFYSHSCYLPPMLLSLFMSPYSHAEIIILVNFTLFPCKSCYCCSFHLRSINNCYSHSFYLPPMLFSLFMSPYSHAEVVILVHFTFFPCRNCYSRSFHSLSMQKLFLLFISPSFHK